MATPVELSMLRAVDNGALLPGLDTVTGNTNSAANLMSIAQIVATGNPAVRYVASSNTFYITMAGATISGVNFGNAEVVIKANNVTINNCTFSSTNNYFSLVQQNGCSGATINNCTFTNNGVVNPTLGAFIESVGAINITNNSFIDCAGDGIDIRSGVISGNSFTGGGGWNSNGAHPDAIWISGSTGPTTITNNYIDWTNSAGSMVADNDCIRITSELGNVSNVTVSGNYLIGGSCSIDAGNIGSGAFSNISITNNYMGFASYGAFYQGAQSGVTASGNVIYDFTNPVISINAWHAYLSNGIATDTLVSATSTSTSISAAKTGTTTLYGNNVKGCVLFGGANENIFIGGADNQIYWGGAGKNIYSYLAMSDSNNSPDAINNFHQGTDVIDLSSINANPLAAGDTPLTFIGTAAFNASGGQVRYYQSGNTTYIQTDLVGDSSADLTIRVLGLYTLTAADFTLTSAQFTAAIAGSIPISYFSTNQAALDQVAGGYKIIDTTANVAGALNALEADNANIGGITLTDSTAKARATITLTSAQVSQDAAILAKITSPYILAISSASSAVPAMLPAAQSNTANVASTANVAPGTVTTSVASAPAVTITLTAAQATQDGGVLANINSPYILDTTSASGTSVTGHGDNLTIAVGSGDTLVTGGGVDETFVFASHFGTTRITDFAANANNAALRDIVSLSTTDFANWATLISDGHASGASNADTTFLAADGASLTIAGVSLHQFQNPTAQLRSDFAFHA